MSVFPIKRVAINANVVGDNTLISGQAGKKYRVLGFILSAAAAGTAQFKSGSNVLTGPMTLGVGVPFVLRPEQDYDMAPLVTNTGEDLVLTTTGTSQVIAGVLIYQEASY